MEAKQPEKIEMEYRKLGPSGLLVPALSFGNMTFTEEKDEPLYLGLIKKCWEYGIKMFDTADMYGDNLSEILLGRILKKLNYPRDEYIISTKIFFTNFNFTKLQPNSIGLSRKHIYEAATSSLKRLQMDNVDIIFCHRRDELATMEEICRGMNWLVEQNKC